MNRLFRSGNLIRASVLLTLLAFAVPMCGQVREFDEPLSSHQRGNEVAKALSEWLVENLEGRGVPGAAWSVVTPNDVVVQETWGYTDLKRTSPISEDTIFCIRSVSKSITALAILMAVQDGLLDLDTPISEYLPDFTINSRYDENPENIITLRHMLAHWASFAHDPPYGIDASRAGAFQNYIDRIPDTWLRFPVGYRHEYSNYGYDLAGYILEQKSGISLAEFIETRIFEPLGMTDSTIDLGVAGAVGNRAIGHKNAVELPVEFPETASGGVYSSIRDMGKWAAFHLNGGVAGGHRLLREDLMRQYHTIQFARDDQRTGYALGLIREPVGPTFSLYHEGGGRGYGSHLMLYPELGLGAVLLTNLEYHGLTGFQGRQVMSQPIREEIGATSHNHGNEAPGTLVRIDDPRVKSILGRYGDSPGMIVEAVDGRLMLRNGASESHDLTVHDENGELVGRYDDASELRFLKPIKDRPGSMMLVNRRVANSNNHYLDYNDSTGDSGGPDRLEWVHLTGIYDVIWEDEPLSSVEVEVRKGHLYFRDGKCEEITSGLFSCYDGNIVDFRSETPAYANQEMRKRAPSTITYSGSSAGATDNMIFIKGGQFEMGDVVGDGTENELPVHDVTLSDFYLSRYEITLAQFRSFIEATGYRTSAEGPDDEQARRQILAKFQSSDLTDLERLQLREQYLQYGGTAFWDAERREWAGYRTDIDWRNPGFGQSDDEPVLSVSVVDAMQYANWLSKQEGLPLAYDLTSGDILDESGKPTDDTTKVVGYRLPTEAEWEYAAREGGRAVRFGNSRMVARSSEMNIRGDDGEYTYSIPGRYAGKTTRVGSFPPNALGLYDMSGNAWEWVSDKFATYNSQPQTNPYITSGRMHSARGGRWGGDAFEARVSHRDPYPINDRCNNTGFRLARSADRNSF